MKIYLLFSLFFFEQAAFSNFNNSSILLDDVDAALEDNFLTDSEETPTRHPQLSTKQGVNSLHSENVVLLRDCSEPLSKDISCSVQIARCSDPISEYVESGKEPPEAHDIRISPTTKVVGSNHIDKRKHRLHVVISWQIPHLANSNYLKAFKLLVNGPEGKNTCFVFNVTQYQLDETVSPRYGFSSNTLFDFGKNYTVTISSYPVSRKKSPQVSVSKQMPENPDDVSKLLKSHEEDCSIKSHPQASKWAASFRKIFLFSAIKMIQIEFLAAPSQYCFEEYEVRLLDSSGIVMLQSAVISKEQLKMEVINNHAVLFGEYNFTNIELDTDLIPSVIPIETSRNGRCLCETENGCSCLAADWKPVKLTKVEKLPSTTNMTKEFNHNPTKDSSTSMGPVNWHSLAIIGVISLALLFGIILCFATKCYRRFYDSKKKSNIHLLNNNPRVINSGVLPLLLKQSLSVLILYSHDSPQHDDAVVAFAELLREVFGMNVHLDVWDEDDIEANRFDYINSSIVRADKVIVINSIGTYFRIVSRQMRDSSLEKIVPGLHDNIFISQIDLALQHPCVLSCRFSYTNPKYVFYPINRLLQYTISESIVTLVTSLSGQSPKLDHFAEFNSAFLRLQSAISRKEHYIETVPQWFENTHHKVARAPQFVEYSPIPMSLGVPFKGTDFAEVEEIEVAELQSLEMKSTENKKPSEMLDHGVSEDQVTDVDSTLGEEITGSANHLTELQRLIVDKDSQDSDNLDSAYVSGSDFASKLVDKHRVVTANDLHDPKHGKDVADSAFHEDVVGVH